MKSMIYILALGLAISNSAQAQRIYYSTEAETGKKDIVSVEVPEGWIQDNSQNQGVNANQVLVKSDAVTSIETGMIFIQTLPLDETLKTVEDVIEHEKMMNTTSNSRVNEYAVITTEKKKTLVEVIRVIGSVDGHQIIGFIPVKNGVVTITLCSESETFLKKHTEDFEALIKSYQLNPIINPPAFAEIVID
jgi:hypothetical protein